MNYSEAFNDEIGYGVGIQGEIEGFLIVTNEFSILLENEEESQKETGRAILVSDPSIPDKLLDLEPVIVGSMVLFQGKAKISGTFVKTGLPIMPVQIVSIETMQFNGSEGNHELTFK